MEFKYKDMIKALGAVEEDKNVSEEVVLNALTQAIEKAYKKDAELDDLSVTARINEKKKTIDLYQNYNVVEDVEDDEFEMSLEDAKELNPDAEIGGVVGRPVEVTGFSRAAISVAKNVMRQSITEAAKMAVYNEYIDKLDEMVIGIVDVVKDKYALINLGKTTAIMPIAEQIPNEILHENQPIRVVIKDVNNGNKEIPQDPMDKKAKKQRGSQVTVSRADKMLVKRLFENEIPEIYNGVVEIKAMAREAGERTKMAVVSYNPDIDPIGACIGPRGARVQEIIEELHGEKIDIFKYSDDLIELVKNALAPAEIEAVLPGLDEKSLRVVVDENQLSLAIGKKGKNARLAHSLTGYNIDIKTKDELVASGLDYDSLLAEAEVKRAAVLKENEEAEIARLEAEAKAAEEKRMSKVAQMKQTAPAPEMEEEGFIPEEMQDVLSEDLATKIDNEETATTEEVKEAAPVEEVKEETAEPAEEPEETEEETEEETMTEQTPTEIAKAKTESHHADLEEMAANNKYVSKFEKLASAPKQKSQPVDSRFKKKYKKKDEENNFKVSNKELAEQLKDKLAKNAEANKPVYSEEELKEIEAQQASQEDSEYDIDYDNDEYEDYYEEDSDK